MLARDLLRLLAWPRSRLWLALPLSYTAGLTLLSALPDPAVAVPTSRALEGMAEAAFSIPPLARNLLHLPLYLALGALVCWALSAWSLCDGRVQGLSWTLAAGYGALNELFQGLTPGRAVSLGDLLTNGVGALCGVGLLALCRRLAGRALTPSLSAPGRVEGLRRADGKAPARWATSVRLDWDERELRLRFECADEDAWSTLTERDAPLWQEEVVEIFVAPGAADPVEYFELEVSPAGVLFDAKVSNPTGRRAELRVDPDWDCPGLRWQVGKGTERQDWWAELALPWRSLVPEGPIPEIFRLNLFRVERPRHGPAEFSAWSPTFTDPPDFHQPRCFGRLKR